MNQTLPELSVNLWVRLLLTDLGLYVHIPFCESKCSYCAFYSAPSAPGLREEYTEKLISEVKKRGAPVVRPVKSLYIGGGTPTVLTAEQLTRIITACKESFNLAPDAEITVEANPADNLSEHFKALAKAGVNRLSLGAQSANEGELKILGRRQSNADVVRTVWDAKSAGINNISLDLMLGIPFQTADSLRTSIDFICSQNPQHISCYILSLEEGTPLYSSEFSKMCADDDTVAELYELMCSLLAERGYEHYEISNFAKQGFRSRHNSHYWQCGEYLGFGPSAHSFFGSRRFFCPPNLDQFLKEPAYIDDGEGGNAGEYIMLGLRLKEGIELSVLENKYKTDAAEILKKARFLERQGLCSVNGDNISLTEKGMLVSNSVINEVMV